MIFRNLTPHPLNVKTAGGDYITLPPAPDWAARVVYDTSPPEQTRIDGHEVMVSVAGPVREIIGLPDPDDNIVLIVSKAVADAAPPNRGDLMSPGRLIRDEDGNVIGCDGLTRRA